VCFDILKERFMLIFFHMMQQLMHSNLLCYGKLSNKINLLNDNGCPCAKISHQQWASKSLSILLAALT
jgi:hypothetical protein